MGPAEEEHAFIYLFFFFIGLVFFLKGFFLFQVNDVTYFFVPGIGSLPYLDDIVPLSSKQDDAMKDNPLCTVESLHTEIFQNASNLQSKCLHSIQLPSFVLID